MHRNSQKRFYGPGKTYFITVKTFQNFPYFEEPIFCKLFVAELKLCKLLKNFSIFAFGLNYDHFHLVVQPEGDANISEIMRSLKTNFSKNANRIMESGGLNILSLIWRAMIINSTFLKAKSRDVFLINNHFRKILFFREKFMQKYKPDQLNFPKFKWKRSFHDHVIRNQRDFENHCRYTVYNFTKHGLPEDWRYTSLYFSEWMG